jgi:type IV pilus assembly protein PilC
METTYFYKARTPEGGLVSGSMLARTNADVVAHLRTRALFITSVVQSDSITGRIESARAWRPVSPPPLVTFFRSFATLIRAGVSVARSLTVTIALCPDTRLCEALQAVLTEIEQGSSLSAALRRRPREFTPLYIAMVEAGEAGGMLDEVLERLASMLEKDLAIRKKVGAALAYPLIVLCATIGLIFFLLTTIVPVFARLFTQLDVAQPASTRILVCIGESMRNPLFFGVTLTSLVAVLFTLSLARRDQHLATVLDTLRLRVALFGTLHRKTVIARLSRMLGSLLHAGVGVLRAVDVCAPLAGNSVYARTLHNLHDALRDGDTITDHLYRCGLFDPMVLQMVRIGEETGTLDNMLLKVAEYYENDIETMTATLSAALEPVLILLVGSVVGFIVYSIFVPMYTLVSSIQ